MALTFLLTREDRTMFSYKEEIVLATEDYFAFSNWNDYKKEWDIKMEKTEFLWLTRTCFNRMVGGMP